MNKAVKICDIDSPNIEYEIREWVEVSISGNYSCPVCGDILVIVPFQLPFTFAFCTQCKKYFLGIT